MPVQINGATSGSVTLVTPAAAGNNTLTLPAATGNIITSADSATVTQAMMASGVAGNGPAFGAYQSSAQSANTANVWTKVQFQTEEFDTANCFDSTTNYRFQPNVAGYYQLNACVQLANANSLLVISGFYKNGSLFKQSGYQFYSASIAGNATGLSALINLNGSTDYVEFWYFCDAARTPSTGQTCTYFNGFLARSN